ncbi:hypothetical protein K491DRAFT_674730 [Lophiostoma macrostomum CBS 122681]|uniref:Uncharacterized protein n=1 Tax=Lophiostoma macrostomum CBS 122681 TaxID=1314788 RepID=A0A6A6TM28_9PLEO|nr:hypothetical protein K491DRAFT_674730 [Lophiostoma macrostomum CBS 122681]
MRYDIEDEVDYGDSPLEAPTPPAELFLDDPITAAAEEPQYDEEPAPQPTPKHVIPEYLQDLIDGRPNKATHIQSDQSATRLKQQKLTSQTLTDFALYQANQKVYEAMFLKAFTAHALHPDVFRVCNGHDDKLVMMEKINEYLQAVVENIDHITDKMIWNAHAKTVNLFVDDDRKSIPFINTDIFKKELFQSFGPDNTSPVTLKMNQSWHRVYKQSGMVQYTVEDYPLVGSAKERSPFNELREASRTVLFSNSTNTSFPKGRVFTLPTKLGTRNSRHDYARVLPIQSRGHATVVPRIRGNARISLQTNDEVTDAKSTVMPAGKENVYTAPSSLMRVSSARPWAEETLHAFDAVSSDAELLHSGGDVACSRQDDQKVDDCVDQDEPQMEPPRTDWRTRLLQDHKRRLEKRRLRLRPAITLSTDYDYIVLRAETQGTLKPMTVETRALLQAHGRMLRKHAYSSNMQRRIAETPSKQPLEPIELAENVFKTTLQRHHQRSATGRSRDGIKGPSPSTTKIVRTNSKRKAAAIREPPKKRSRKASNVPKKARIEQNDKAHIPHHSSSERSDRTRINDERIPEQAASPLPTHPSGSLTLEPDQVLPPDAYFEKVEPNEKFVWRCGIKHACGYYYNAGDRKSCIGCGTNISANPKARTMDFYLPSMKWFKQPAPDITWKPSILFKASSKVARYSHNAIAKVRYWEAINDGADPAEARQRGIEAIEEHLRPKPKREPTPDPTPSPEPEPVDLGPHPSGSTTMEHGQGIPECAYFDKKEKHEEFAWRCDGGHAFGRYYMAYDRNTCPGCGLGMRTTGGKRTTMDFYLPSGTVVRQEAKGIADWFPRKLYKTKKGGSGRAQVYTHNQMVTRKYWDAVGKGEGSDQALELALIQTDAELDAKAAVAAAKRARESEPETETDSEDESDKESRKTESPGQERGVVLSLTERGSSGGVTPGQVIFRAAEVVNDSDDDSDVDSSSSDSE